MINKIICMLVLLVMESSVQAQTNLSGQIKYTVTRDLSEFYTALGNSEKSEEEKHIVDSLSKKYGFNTSKINVATQLMIFDKSEIEIFRSMESVNIPLTYQNLVSKTSLSIGVTASRKYLVLDTMTTISWKLLKEMKKIQNIDCFSAQAEYRGRVWTAWYAPSIPISSGPWKLYGLPGMVLEAVDRDGLMQFECTKIDISKEKNIQLNTTDPFLNNKEKNITQKEYVIKLKKSIDNYRKMRADKNQMGGGASINGIEIFEFEKDIISQRIQQKLSDTPKK